MDHEKKEQIRTRIWLEEPEPDNPYATRAAYCHGYNVHGELIGKARWVEMLYLLLNGEAPKPDQASLLETVAVLLANPGPRDPSIHAAMCGGVGGSTAAACLIAALAVGAGQSAGAREVFLAVELWHSCKINMESWERRLTEKVHRDAPNWPDLDRTPGFEPYATTTSTVVKNALTTLSLLSPGLYLPWLQSNLDELEAVAGRPLAMSGVAAAAFADLGFSPEQAEMLHLLLRLPGAAAHALEQWQYGHKKFPFFKVDLENDPTREAR